MSNVDERQAIYPVNIRSEVQSHNEEEREGGNRTWEGTRSKGGMTLFGC